MTKVAIYARVSMDEADDTKRQFQSPENQLIPLRDWAKSQNWDIVGEYIDKCSGADHNRPSFIRMLNDAMLLKFNIIIVWKLDRFSREGIGHTLSYIERLRTRSVAIKSMTESWLDTSKDNPISEMLLAVMSWVAAEERRKISERTKLGIQRRRNLGQWKGGRPKGSKNLIKSKIRVAPLSIEDKPLAK